MIFGKRKTKVEVYEEEFKTERMKDRHLFYDLYIKAGDPEEVRAFSAELVETLDFRPVLNILTKFEDVEFEEIFKGGRLKPVKCILRATKELRKGPRYPLAWKGFALLCVISLFLYLFPTALVGVEFNRELLIYSGSGSALLSLIIYMIKEKISLFLWLKIAGIYDVSSEESNIRLIIAGDCDKKEKTALAKLEEDLSEVYNVLARKYVKRKKEKEVVVVVKKKKAPELKILGAMKGIDKELAELDKRLAEGKISEETYKDVKASLQRRRSKLETLLDLVTA
jgi:hypothetical protein